MPPASRLAIPFAHRAAFVSTLIVAVCAIAWRADAAPTPGFVESFPGTSVGSWTSLNNPTNPGTGGALGAGDGFLLVSTPGFNSNLGAVGTGAEYVGNWTTAGITEVKLKLADVNTANPLELHFAIGNTANFWQYDIGMIPPAGGAWTDFTVPLTSSTNFTRIIGTGTFADALANADRILVRHDNAPYVQTPNTLNGDFGLDEVTLVGSVAGVPPTLPPMSQAVQLAAPYPNPSSGPVVLSLQSFTSDAVRIEIVDVTGRIVRQTTLASASGPRLWTWDGLDQQGSRAPAGVYRVRAYGPAGGTSRALVRLAR